MAREKKAKKAKEAVNLCPACKHDNIKGLPNCEECGAFLPSEFDMRDLNDKQHFAGSLIRRLSDDPVVKVGPPFRTGSRALDLALGGGIPRNSQVGIFGENHLGKTTLALSIATQAQKDYGAEIGFVDMEHTLTQQLNYCKAIGLDLSKVWYVSPLDGTQAFNYVEEMLLKCPIVILDCLANCDPGIEIVKESKYDKNTGVDKVPYSVGALARLIGTYIPRWNRSLALAYGQHSLIITNQTRTHMAGQHTYVDEKGGRAIKFFYTLRMKLDRVQQDEITNKEGAIVGRKVKVSIIKAKHIGTKYATEIELGPNGIDKARDLVNIGLQYGLITSSGSWFDIGHIKLQGVNAIRAWLAKGSPEALKLETDIDTCMKTAIDSINKCDLNTLDQILKPIPEDEVDKN